MARIKTKKYTFGNQEIDVNFNCSSSGLFSTNLHFTIEKKLGISGRLEGSSLKEIEDILDEAFRKYKDANTSYRLLIAICFGARGYFTMNHDNTYNLNFDKEKGKYKMSGMINNLTSCIGIDFKVVIEENRDGRVLYYNAMKRDQFPDFHFTNYNYIEVGDYVSTSDIYMSSDYKLIEFSETALNNLESIKEQFRKASSFIVELLTNENVELILGSNDLKLLN